MDFTNDIFLGVREDAGTFTVKNEDGTTAERAYHYFLVNIALADMLTNDNTVSHCGYEVMGIDKNGSHNGDAIYKDWRKIKAEDMSSIFGFEVPNADVFADKILKPCQVYFNRKGNVSRVVFLDDKKGGK